MAIFNKEPDNLVIVSRRVIFDDISVLAKMVYIVLCASDTGRAESEDIADALHVTEGEVLTAMQELQGGSPVYIEGSLS